MSSTNSFTLTAEPRTGIGKAASRRLRRLEDKIPAILYGGGQDPMPLTLEHRKVTKALENEAFYSHILKIEINGKSEQAVLKAVHRHPYKPKVLHIDLLRITGKEKITMRVPLHFIGESVAPGVKQDKGIISHLMIDVEIFCFPADLPEYIEVDISNLGLDESLHLSDLKLPKGVEIVALMHGADHNLPVVSIHLPRAAAAADEENKPAEAGAEGTATTAKPEGKKEG